MYIINRLKYIYRDHLSPCSLELTIRDRIKIIEPDEGKREWNRWDRKELYGVPGKAPML